MTETIFNGTFEGTVEGVTTTLTMSQKGSSISGVGKAENKQYRFEGTVEGSQAKGTVEEPGEPQSAIFRARFDGDALLITLSRRFLPVGRTYRFTRSS